MDAINVLQFILIFALLLAVAALWKPRLHPAAHLVIQLFNSDAHGEYLVDQSKDTIMLTLRKGDTRTVRIRPIDADGNTTTLDGVPYWDASSDAVTVTAAEDGLSASILVNTAASSVQVSVSGDGAQGDTTTTITGTLDITVLPTDAVSISIDVDPAVA